MCRLVGYRGPAIPLHTPFLGGTHSLFRQSWAARELRTGSVNVDGYGIAWAPDDGKAELVRLARLEPAWHDPDLPGLLSRIRSGRILAALRNATPGLPVDRAGLLPYVHGPWAMAMNGYVPEFRQRHMRALRAPLEDPWYGRLVGSSDAETLFLRVLQMLEAGTRPAEALRSLVKEVIQRLSPNQAAPLTLVLLGPTETTVCHTTWSGPLNSLYLGRAMPLVPEEGVLLASEPLDDHPGWTPVAADSITRIGTESVVVEPL